MKADSTSNLIVACGSLFLLAGAVPEVVRADGAVVVDVSKELAGVRLGSPALAVSLGQGETTATLMARMIALRPEFKELRDALLALGPVDLDDGLGMLASLRRVAGLVEFDKDHVGSRIDQDVVIPLLRLHNGVLRRVCVWRLSSLAGGVGALGASVFEAETALVITQKRP